MPSWRSSWVISFGRVISWGGDVADSRVPPPAATEASPAESVRLGRFFDRLPQPVL